MARKKSDDRLKRALLLFFVALSVALIIGIYVTELSGGNESAPGFQRGVPVEDWGLGLTSSAWEIGDWGLVTRDAGYMIFDI